MHYFILTPPMKILALYYENTLEMYNKSNHKFGNYQTISTDSCLILKVRREYIFHDTLCELGNIVKTKPSVLKKQIFVQFDGEEGIDEGGLTKEFFQLIVKKIFHPDYYIFTYEKDTRTMWFTRRTYTNAGQYFLIGILFGLAIHNNVMLNLNFPMVFYRKLMGTKGSFYDLADLDPTIYNSLQYILDYNGSDMEEVFLQTFEISYKNSFGKILKHELLENGRNIFVNQENKKKFVDLYSDFLLNSSIEKQFTPFRNGFKMVIDELPLKLLFRVEEIELLLCGSKHFDVSELQETTEYENGYHKNSKTIKHFWYIVNKLPLKTQKKLLEFITGSDRVPAAGLGQIRLVIHCNGPDSDQLPRSRTCFNLLFLPEYSSKKKLGDRLLTAIHYSEGFGMP